jgi:hypothetical protein
MKKTILLIFLFIMFLGFSQTNPSTSSNPLATVNCTELTKISKSLTKIDSALTQKCNTEKQNEINKQNCTNKELTFYQKLLVMMPVLFFIALLFIVLKTGEKVGFNFKQAFYCEEPETKIESAATDANPSATITTTVVDINGNPIYYLSSSRLIAFLSALTTLIIVVCIMCYYAFCMMKCHEMPDLKHLMELFLALGLGIIPYGINRLTAPVKTS